MLHALGNPIFDKRTKLPVTALNACYRNKFFCFKKDKEWEDLVKKGYAKCKYTRNRTNKSDEYWYYVTVEGMNRILNSL